MGGKVVRLAAAALPMALSLAAALPAQPATASPKPAVPSFAGFHSVLAQGEGQTINAVDLAAYEINNTPPPSFVNQQPLYVGVMPAAGTLTLGNLGRYYKNTTFGQMPGGVASSTSPPGHPNVTIYRDARFNMAHVYGTNRDELMFGAGYAQAQERLFLMDVIRRTAEGTLAGLVGPSAASGDASQLTDQDFSAQELTKQFNELPQKYGVAGARAHRDLVDFVAGINAYIAQAKIDPRLMPAEYAALGASPAPWTVADTAAEAVLLITQFTVSNGDEQVNEQLQLEFQKQFGSRWRAIYNDFREANDPEALTVAKVPFRSDNPGPVEPRLHLNAYPDLGSITSRNTQIAGPSAADQARARAALPSWARSAVSLRSVLPPVESNALMVSRKLSGDGRALAAMGPQVGYYSPQIFSEYELHGGGIDSEGVTFPGASPYPLIGHGIDFAWSGTSANGDNEDTFVERLCNPNGSSPSERSTHYIYKGRCVPFLMRTQSVTTPYSPLNPNTPPQKISYRTMRSVHGPVFAYATVGGRPVALSKAKAVDFHELSAVLSFMHLSENKATNVSSFMRIMGTFPGTENWFYVDHRDVGWIQSGFYQRHALHSDVDLPWWGDGRADWLCFRPSTYTECDIPSSHRPQAVNPSDGFIISWNNIEAPGWHPAPTDWGSGPIHHALILQQRLYQQLAAGNGRTDLAGVARDANLTATTDLRGFDDYPWMRKVIGRPPRKLAPFLKLMDAWYRAGAHRLAPAGSNVYAHSDGIALFDTWWPLAVHDEFEPALGPELFKAVTDHVLSLPTSGFNYNWTSQVQKDMRSALGAPERGRYSHLYCGGPLAQPQSGLHGRALQKARARCRALLLRTLSEAISTTEARRGANPAKWKVYATCSDNNCDQENPTTAGAVATPPFPWQDRGTYHQVTEVSGHR